ncbi:MAG: carbon monoxide dehydrogenase beta subunit family protein [Nitrospinales bacterium]
MPKLELGPIGLLPPSAASQGIFQPEPHSGCDMVEGEHVSSEKAMEVLAHKLLTLRNPTLFPGPLIIWAPSFKRWDKEWMNKAALSLKLVEEVPGMNIIPMPDYRPIYPKIDPEAVISPCHPNLTILHNKIQVCVFIGQHCHFANVTLKMIRANTSCYTVVLCPYCGHEEALLAIQDLDSPKLQKIIDTIKKMKDDGLTPWALTPEGKEELAEIKARQDTVKAESIKEETRLFMGDLEQGLDENAE